MSNENELEFWLDIESGCLRKGLEEIHLTPKAFKLLCFFAERPKQLINQRDLVAGIWINLYVSDDTVRHYIRELRNALADSPRTPQFIVTVHGRGYRFIGSLPIGQPLFSSSVLHRPTSVPVDRPSIAVLPFVNLSHDPEQDYFCDGISEDLITDLCTLRGLRVIAHQASFVYRNRDVDVRKIGQELGVRYVLQGSVRKLGEMLRINAKLIEATSGEHTWVNRCDCLPSATFTVQDELCSQIINALEVKLIEGEQARLWCNTTANPDAIRLFRNARQTMYKQFNQEGHLQTKHLLDESLALDPQFAAAWFSLAYVYDCLSVYSAEPNVVVSRGIDAANKALEIEPAFGDAYAVLSLLQERQCQHEIAFQTSEQAVSLMPNSYVCNIIYMGFLAEHGRIDEALATAQKVWRLIPLPYSWYKNDLGYIYLCDKQYDRAINTLKAGLETCPDNLKGRRFLMLAYAMGDYLENGRDQVQEILRLNPYFSMTKHLLWWVQYPKDIAEREEREKKLLAVGLPA